MSAALKEQAKEDAKHDGVEGAENVTKENTKHGQENKN